MLDRCCVETVKRRLSIAPPGRAFRACTSCIVCFEMSKGPMKYRRTNVGEITIFSGKGGQEKFTKDEVNLVERLCAEYNLRERNTCRSRDKAWKAFKIEAKRHDLSRGDFKKLLLRMGCAELPKSHVAPPPSTTSSLDENCSSTTYPKANKDHEMLRQRTLDWLMKHPRNFSGTGKKLSLGRWRYGYGRW